MRATPGVYILRVTLALMLCVASAQAAAEDIPIDVRLTADASLPSVARQVLMDEASAIWRHAGVTLRWTQEQEHASLLPPLRVLVIQGWGADSHVVAELVRFDSGVTAVARLTQAEAIIATASVATSDETRQLGVVLGRAVAHEIGHYLLGHAHTRHGLMRAAFHPHEFAGADPVTFVLDPASRRRLHDGRALRVLAHPVQGEAFQSSLRFMRAQETAPHGGDAQ